MHTPFHRRAICPGIETHNSTNMKSLPFLALAATFTLTSCDVKVDKSDPPTNTTVVVPGKEKKTENNTTIVNPPKEEKKVENNTTIVNPPKEEKTVEKKETTIIK